jgi:beta-ribofuranosylaminobenzene 5'-phosphate synthase
MDGIDVTRIPSGQGGSTVLTGLRVHAPARLHFGFLDLHGGLGRRFGSIGLALDAPAVTLTARRCERLDVTGPEARRAAAYALAAATHLGIPGHAALTIEDAIPAHAGFGSGTQLALSVAAALAGLAGRPFAPEDFADALDRGNRSGVGLAAFTQGGLIVDGGRDPHGNPPPVIARLAYPEAWRVVLILDTGMTGVHGVREVAAFRDLPRFPEAQAAEICRLVLMQVLPALATAEPDGFGAGITRIQRPTRADATPAPPWRRRSRPWRRGAFPATARVPGAPRGSRWCPRRRRPAPWWPTSPGPAR